MRQAIETKFRGPTNCQGARVVARAQAGRLVVSWDHGESVEENHRRAALRLAERYGWPSADMVGGGNAKGDGYVWVF